MQQQLRISLHDTYPSSVPPPALTKANWPLPAVCVQVSLGLAAGSGGFVWDNELTTDPQPRSVPAFLLAAAPVTVRQFREFVLSHKVG